MPDHRVMGFDFNPVGINWTTGVHHLRVDVTDAAGNTTTRPWTVQYYATSWAYGNTAGVAHDG